MKIIIFILMVLFLSLAAPSWAKTCISDITCGIGNVCVKEPFHGVGTCMKEVDQYGLPTYNSPSDRSLNIPTEGECDFNTDCPIGFFCHKKYKVCIKR